MIQSLRLFFKQGRQYIGNLFTAQVDKKYRGFPQFKVNLCTHCSKCIKNCPVNAIAEDLTVDIDKCQFCGECVRNCPSGAANFCNFHHTGSTDREKLKIAPDLVGSEKSRFIYHFGRCHTGLFLEHLGEIQSVAESALKRNASDRRRAFVNEPQRVIYPSGIDVTVKSRLHVALEEGRHVFFGIGEDIGDLSESQGGVAVILVDVV